jgi:ribonuclease-3
LSISAAHKAELEAKLGYSFVDDELLQRALTHRSYAKGAKGSGGNQTGAASNASNELLEYLGDAVLGLLVSEFLVQAYPEASEGELSKRRSQLVSATHLHHAAERLGLGKYLLLGRGEERAGGRAKKTLLADTMEALLAAVYLDSGLEKARKAVGRWVLDAVDGEDLLTTDYKTALQELLQQRKLQAPRYVVSRERGPEHRKVFTVRALVAGESIAEGEGNSKKSAEQAAARIALEELTRQAV